MRNRLIILPAMMLACSSASASVITFDAPGDLAEFNQAPNFWTATSGAGLDGTTGLTGPNSGQNAWVTYSTGFDSKATSVSGGIYFKLIASEVESGGFSISFGVSSSSNYTPNVTTTTVPDNSKNHYSGILQYSASPTARLFRVSAHQSANGTLATSSSGYHTLSYDAWYFLSLESTFDAATSLYSVTVDLHSSSDGGVVGASIMTASLGDFALPALTNADENYFFFGLIGRPATRGIAALDNFTYQSVPEPSAAVSVIGFLGMLGAWRLARRPRLSKAGV